MSRHDLDYMRACYDILHLDLRAQTNVDNHWDWELPPPKQHFQGDYFFFHVRSRFLPKLNIVNDWHLQLSRWSGCLLPDASFYFAAYGRRQYAGARLRSDGPGLGVPSIAVALYILVSTFAHTDFWCLPRNQTAGRSGRACIRHGKPQREAAAWASTTSAALLRQ